MMALAKAKVKPIVKALEQGLCKAPSEALEKPLVKALAKPIVKALGKAPSEGPSKPPMKALAKALGNPLEKARAPGLSLGALLLYISGNNMPPEALALVFKRCVSLIYALLIIFSASHVAQEQALIFD